MNFFTFHHTYCSGLDLGFFVFLRFDTVLTHFLVVPCFFHVLNFTQLHDFFRLFL